jgi:integrase
VGLFSPDILSILHGAAMKGKVRTQQKCPVCKSKFQHIPRLGYICPAHKTIPRRFYLDLWNEAKSYKIFSDKSGQPISAYDRAYYLLERINEEISGHRFDPSNWIHGEAKKFYVPELIERYYAAKKGGLAPSWREYYKKMLDRCGEFFALRDVREILKIDVWNLVEHLKKTVKGKTLKNHLGVFHTFLQWAKDVGVLDSVPSFPEIEVTEKPIRWLNQEDQIRVFESVPQEDRPIIAFLMLHGCRPGEARALRIKDVDLANQTIAITSTWSKTELREKRKGRHAKPMTICIHPELMPFMASRTKDSLPGAFVFLNPRVNEPYTQSAIKRLWVKVRESAGVDLRLYDATRHSFASQLVNAGTSIFKVSKLLGHSSTRMTEKYSHADLGSLRIDLEKVSLKKVVRLTGSEPEEEMVAVKNGK